jgi:hypothetical protein
VKHPQELAIMAGNAQKYVELNYSWEQITAENLKLYKTLLDSSANIKTPEPHSMKIPEVVSVRQTPSAVVVQKTVISEHATVSEK